MNIRDDILQDLKSRGLSDADISELDAEQLFDEFCNWNGLMGWGPTLVGVLDHLREVDLVVTRQEQE